MKQYRPAETYQYFPTTFLCLPLQTMLMLFLPDDYMGSIIHTLIPNRRFYSVSVDVFDHAKQFGPKVTDVEASSWF